MPTRQAEETSSVDQPAKHETDNLIYQAEHNGVIDAERADFLELMRKQVSKKMLKGPVLVGEQHFTPDSSLLTKQLIAEGKVKNLVLEQPRIPIANWDAENVALALARRKGYPTLEDYLAEAPVINGVRKYPEVLQVLIKAVSSESFLNQIVVAALKANVEMFFVDDHTELEKPLADLEYRNQLMAHYLKNIPALSAPGTLGVFGAAHFNLHQLEGQLLPSLPQQAGIPESQVFSVSPAFIDPRTGKYYPRWSQLKKSSDSPVTPAELYPFRTITSKETGLTTLVPDKYDHRIVVDRVNSPASKAAAADIVRKWPANTLVLKTTPEGELEYGGQGVYNAYVSSADVDQPKNNTKFYVLHSEDSGDASFLMPASRAVGKPLRVKKATQIKFDKGLPVIPALNQDK